MRFPGRVVSALILLFAASSVTWGQTPSGKLSFDVATVKPSALDMQKLAAAAQAGKMPKIGPEIGATRATYTFMSLSELISMAWNVRPYQISGPDWLSKERFDIEATMPDGATRNDAPAMLQSLLEERFKLAAHRAQEEHKVLALVVSKSGIKMKESATPPQAFDPDSPLQPGETQMEGLDGPVRMKIGSDGTVTQNMGAKGTIIQKFDRQTMTFHFKSSGVTMVGYAELLSTMLLQLGGPSSRQVVDMTGLKGYYELDTEISMADIMALARNLGMDVPTGPPSGGANTAPEASDPGGGSSVFESIQQMGLKLENSKATVDRLVIDHIERTPTEN